MRTPICVPWFLLASPLAAQMEWVQRSPSVRPTGRIGHAMAYDPVRERVVLFGGWGPGVHNPPLEAVWEWDGAAWSWQLPTVRPPASLNAAMAHDQVGGGVLLFDGLGSTWRWNGSAWLQLLPSSSPPARHAAAMALDPATQRVYLFGGFDLRGLALSDTWSWDGSTWQRLSTTLVPPARGAHGLALLPGKGLLMSGGWDGARSLTDTWLLTNHGPSVWSPVACAVTPGWGPMVGDSERLRVVRHAGSVTGELEWTVACWNPRTTAQAPSTVENAMAFDQARGETVLFGGQGAGSTYPDATWVYRPVARPRSEPFGAPCKGSLGDVSLRSGPPVLGMRIELVASTVATPIAMLAVGHSSTRWGNVSLPLDLSSSGMPGCALRVAPLWLEPVHAMRLRDARWQLLLPNDPALLGAIVFAQAFAADSLPPVGIVGSDGLRLVLGGW